MYIFSLENANKILKTCTFEHLSELLEYTFGYIYEQSECQELLINADKLIELTDFISGKKDTFKDDYVTLSRA